MTKKSVEIPTVLLKASKRGMSEISHDGETYTVDKDGFVEVPVADMDVIMSHGFREATEDDIKPASTKKAS